MMGERIIFTKDDRRPDDDPRNPLQQVRLVVREGREAVTIDADFYPCLEGDQAFAAMRVAFEGARRLIESGRKTKFWISTGGSIIHVNPKWKAFDACRWLSDLEAEEDDPSSSGYLVKAPRKDTEVIERALKAIVSGDCLPANMYANGMER